MRILCLFAVLAMLCVISSSAQANHIVPQLRGDFNLSGSINLTDVVAMSNWLFAGGPGPVCLDAADANNDGAHNGSDPIFLVNYLFGGGPAPAPFLVNCPGTH